MGFVHRFEEIPLSPLGCTVLVFYTRLLRKCKWGVNGCWNHSKALPFLDLGRSLHLPHLHIQMLYEKAGK